MISCIHCRDCGVPLGDDARRGLCVECETDREADRRDMFAAHALQGLCANEVFYSAAVSTARKKDVDSAWVVTMSARDLADAQIAALDGRGEGK